MATLITHQQRVRAVQPKSGRAFSLEEMQKLVGGFIQIIPIGEGVVMVMDEEGKIKQKPLNKRATNMAAEYLDGRDFIVGDVVVCNLDEAGYETGSEAN